MSGDDRELDDLDAIAAEDWPGVALPADPWDAVLAAARMQGPDPVLVALLQVDHGWSRSDAEEMVEAGYDEVVAARRVGQLDLIRQAHKVVRADPGSPPAVALLRLLLGNHLGWVPSGQDREMRKMMRQLERMTPAERSRVLAAAAEIEGRA